MDKLFGPYRILAFVVGVLLTFNTFVVLPLTYFTKDGTSAQNLGEDLSLLWILHGWAYMAYVVVAFILANRARWKAAFTVLVLISGAIPLLVFWVERKVAEKLRADLASAAPGA